jgi:hypothetical protein
VKTENVKSQLSLLVKTKMGFLAIIQTQTLCFFPSKPPLLISVTEESFEYNHKIPNQLTQIP